MDNLTHSLVGLAAAKAGLEKLSPACTTLCILAANSPDADVVVGFFADRWTLLKHHRGITHSIVGTITLALVLALLFYGIDLLIARWKQRPPKVQLRGLVLASLIVTATHPILDWMNNYGVRPFLPWSSQWAYGDLIYIVDPFLWLLFGGATFLLTSKKRIQKVFWVTLATVLTSIVLFGPARRGEVSNPSVLYTVWIGAILLFAFLFFVKIDRRWGERIAIGAFVIAAVYLIGLSIIHRSALSTARAQAAVIAGSNGETVAKLAVMPTLANPLRWDCTFRTDAATYRFRFDLVNGSREERLIRYAVPAGPLAAAVQQVAHERSLNIFLDFARFPVGRLKDPGCRTQTLLQLADLRYTEPGRGRVGFALELPVNCSSLGMVNE